MFKSFKKLSALLLGGALLAVGCATEGDIHKLNERIDALITGKVANIENQITLLQQADVTLENALKGEIATAKADLTKEIDALKAADVQFRTDMNNNVTNLTNLIRDNKADIEGKLNQAKTDFTNAIGAANEKIHNLELADENFKGKMTLLEQKVDNNFNTLQEGINAAKAAAEAADAMLDAKKVDKTDFDAAKTALEGMISAAESAAKQYTDGVKTDLQGQIDKKADAAQVAQAFSDLETAYKAADDALQAAINNLQTNKADKTQVAADIAAASSELSAKIDQAAAAAATALSNAVSEINRTIADAKTEFAGEIARLDGEIARLDAAVDKINDETIPAIEQQIADLKDLAERTYVTKADFDAYKEATATTIRLMQDAIDGLTGGLAALGQKVDDNYNELDGKITTTNATLEGYYNELKGEDTLIRQALEEFKAIAATKAELQDAKDVINGRIDGVEQAYKDADAILEQGIKDARDYADQQDAALEIMITAAYKQAIKDLADDVKETTDALDGRLTNVESEVDLINLSLSILQGAIQQVMDAVQAVDEKYEGEVGRLDDKIDTKVGELEGKIEGAAAQTLADAKAYTDEKVGEIWEEINDIWDSIDLIKEVLDDFDSRVNQLEAYTALLAMRLQSLTYVPDYDDMKMTMNVAYVKNGNEIMPVPQKTQVTYKFMPEDMAEKVWNVYEYYEELGMEALETPGLGGYALNSWFYFDVTGKLKTRSAEAQVAGLGIEIVDLVTDEKAETNLGWGYLTFEVLPVGIVTEGFVASELNPIDVYCAEGITEGSIWGVAYRLTDYCDFTTGKEVGDPIYSGADVKFPVYDAAQLEAYRNRDSYAVALEFAQPDASYAQPYTNLIDWENCTFDQDYDDINPNSVYSYEELGSAFGYLGLGLGANVNYEQYTYGDGDNKVSSCYNVLYPSPLAESLVVDILKDPFKNDPENPRADEKGWVNMREEEQTLPYNMASDSTDVDGNVIGTKVILDECRPLVAVDGVKYTYDELFNELGIYVDYPELTESKYSYDKGTANADLDEDNFQEGTKDSEAPELDEYLTIAMNDDASLAAKKLAVGNVITGTYTWDPGFGEPFDWNGYVKIVKSEYKTTATAHIDWTYEFDADVDHDNFYNRRDEEGNVPIDGYFREVIPVTIPEGVIDDLSERYGIEDLAELFEGDDPMQFIGYTVSEGGDITYKNTDEEQKAVFGGLSMDDEGNIFVGVTNFEFLPRDAKKTYTVVATFETSNISFEITFTLTTYDRDRTPIKLSFGETAVKLNDPEFYNLEEDFFTAKSADKAADLYAKFIEQKIFTAENFADAAAFTNDQTGEVRNSPIDRLPGTQAPEAAWYDIYKVYAKTLSGKLTSELLKEINGVKQEESRYTYIGQEVQCDWTVKVELPGYDYLHLSYYTFNADKSSGSFIQKYNFEGNPVATRGLDDPKQHVEWWTRVNPSYFTGDEDKFGEPISFRHALADYDVAYINLAELAFNIVDKTDAIMTEEQIAENQIVAKFDYFDENLAAKNLPTVDQIDDIMTYANLWMDPTVFYYRTNERLFIRVKGSLAIKSGNTDVLFELPTRFDTPKASVKYPDVVLDYSNYAVVRWTPFKEPVAEGYTMILDENKIYRIPLFKGMYLKDNRPSDVSYDVIKDGEWVVGNVTEYDAEAGTYSEGGNGYIEGIRADEAYHITTTFTYDDLSLEPSLRKLLSLQYYGPALEEQPQGEEVENVFLTKAQFEELSDEAKKAYVPYIVYDYRSEVEFRGKVVMPVVVILENPWQEALKFKYNFTIQGVNYVEPEVPAEPVEPVEP